MLVLAAATQGEAERRQAAGAADAQRLARRGPHKAACSYSVAASAAATAGAACNEPMPLELRGAAKALASGVALRLSLTVRSLPKRRGNGDRGEKCGKSGDATERCTNYDHDTCRAARAWR